MEEKKLVPKKRFKGHENIEWNKIKLGDYAIIKGRLGWKSLKKEEYIDNGPSMIAGRHIKNGIIDWNEVDHIPLWRYEESPEIMLKNNDVIFSKDGSLGNPAIITGLKDKATINATMMLVRINGKLAASYFYQILNSKRFHELVYLKVSGSSIPHLFQEDMKSFRFYAPDISEQQKIGEFFKVLDERIANQERKIAKVKALKTAYLTEMFPQEGETVPKRRFKGFEEEWKKYKLKDRTSIITKGTTPKNPTSSGQVNFVKVENIENDKILPVSKITEEEHENYLKRSKLELNDILFSIAGTLGRVSIVKKSILPANTNQALAIIRGHNFNSDFLLTSLSGKVISEFIKRNPTIGAQPNLSLEQVGNFKIYAPTFEEQQKIGEFFKNLDNQIQTEEKKLDKLQKMKEAYLEEMFV